MRPVGIGFGLSILWLVGTTVVLDRLRKDEVGRLTRQCHQIQADARTTAHCLNMPSPELDPLCRHARMDCDHWPLEEAAFVRGIASIGGIPIVLGWAVALGLAAHRRRRHTTERPAGRRPEP
jgi:hypothetical protein